MRQVIENTIESYTVRAITTWVLVGISMFAVVLYAFFVNKAIFQAVEAKRISIQNASITSSLNTLQEQFLSLQNSATLERASTLGLSEKEAERFISRKALGQGLSLRGEI